MPNWTDDAMMRAQEEVAAGMPVRRASRVFRVPRSTLKDRRSGRVTHGCRTGRRQKLSKTDEEALVQYCLYCASHGFPLTKARLLAYASAVWRKRSGISPEDPPLGKKWWGLFKKRHAAVLSMRTPENIDRQRSSKEQGQSTGTPGSQTPVRAGPRYKGPHNCSGLFQCSWGDVPPFIIYKKHFPGGRYTEGGPPNALYGKSPAGYIDSELFLRWFQHFLLHATPARPLLLLFDGHKSHLSIDVIEAAKGAGVVLLHLPPHTSHVLQPLDVGFFGPLKADFATVAGNLCHFKNSYIVNRTEFAKVFRHPYQRAKARGVVQAGFKECSIYPLDRTVIKSSRLIASGRSSTTTTTITTTITTTTVTGPSSSSPVGTSASPQPSQQPSPPPSPSPTHPLVAAGLIPPDLAAVLTRVDQPKTTQRRVTGEARVVTGEEYERLLNEREERCAAAREAKEQRAEQRRERANTIGTGTTNPNPRGAPSCRDRPSPCSTPVPPSAPPPSTSSVATPRTPARASSSSSSSTPAATSSTHNTREKTNNPLAPMKGKKRKRKMADEGGRQALMAQDEDTCGRCHRVFPPGEEDIVPWVYCPLCREWYHSSCEEFEDWEEEFECRRCQGIRASIMAELKIKFTEF
ncbi:uncharacterized protein LOC134466068 [Engraulis encrasicolus]|uniref:uncharacterized protein LOC134466068 n=1 Tax=Engraulis encrasicolus TaxID=184585 RepID=UPI002FD28DD9